MRLALHITLPGLEECLAQRFPDLEVLHIPMTGALPENCDADILLTVPLVTTNLEHVLQQLPSLKWVHSFSTGIDGFPFQMVGDRLLSCSRGATAIAISEWVIAMILSCDKRLPQSWISEPPEQWNFSDLHSLQDKTLGLIGFGSIGQAVAQRALAFDMRVIAKVRSDRDSPNPQVEFVASLEYLLAESDHIVLALPATPSSHHLLNRDRLEHFKSGAHLINVARADIIDHDALRQALDAGRVGLASLDVCDPEPLPAEHWLYQHEQVRLSPHISWNSPQAFDKMSKIFIDNLDAFINQDPLSGLVNTQAGY